MLDILIKHVWYLEFDSIWCNSKLLLNLLASMATNTSIIQISQNGIVFTGSFASVFQLLVQSLSFLNILLPWNMRCRSRMKTQSFTLWIQFILPCRELSGRHSTNYNVKWRIFWVIKTRKNYGTNYLEPINESLDIKMTRKSTFKKRWDSVSNP